MLDKNAQLYLSDRRFLLVGRYYQRRVYGINTLSVHLCRIRTRTCMRKVRKQANVHSTIIYQPRSFLSIALYMWIFGCFWM